MKHTHKNTTSLDTLRAAREASQLIRDRMAVIDHITGLRQHLAAHTPRGSTRYVKGARSTPSLWLRAGEGAVGKFVGKGLLGDAGVTSGGFYESTSQIADRWSQLFGLAGRDS